MLKLANPLSVSGGARAVRMMRNGNKSPAHTRTVASDDAVAVVIRNPLYAYRAETDAQDPERDPFLNLSVEDTLAAVEKKVAELKQLAEDIRGGRFSATQTGDKPEADTEDIRGKPETAADHMDSDVSELVAQFREEIEKIKSSDGFLLGVHDKIEEFKPPAEYDLDQVRDVEQHMAEVNSKLELGIFSLARVREKALKALRCQDEPQPERVLKLLADEPPKPSAAQ